MKYYCNPLNLEYRYQYSKASHKESDDQFRLYREAADPSLVYFKENYLMFASMSAGFYYSKDLVSWNYYKLNEKIPIYDYAPDVCVIGEYLYFCASKRNENCSFYRTKDPFNGKFEKIEGDLSFWDPKLFEDDDKRLYLYWGCSNLTPIYGVELDQTAMKAKSEPIVMFDSNEAENGFDRNGDDYIPPKSKEQIEELVQLRMKQIEHLSNEELLANGLSTKEEAENKIRLLCGNRPCIEGAWMTKYEDTYYLQYAIPGTQYNTYADAVYVSKSPLGPFTLANNNPFSFKPGGFITGAGHGSTLKDENQRYWHASTMRISKNDKFERRIGLWKSGFDEDGELYCDQRYGDWPICVDDKPFSKPKWMLLSYQKAVKTSSGINGMNVVDEDIQTWWTADTNKPNEWIEVDLGKIMEVHAVQLNFADNQKKVELPIDAKCKSQYGVTRYLDMQKKYTRWKLEASVDGVSYEIIEDKTTVLSDLAHDLYINEEGLKIRYIRVTFIEVPYNFAPCISGLRVFGDGKMQSLMPVENITFEVVSDLDVIVRWDSNNTYTGVNIIWGYQEDKLYHSWMVYGKNKQSIGALRKGQNLYMRIDTFHESSIHEGNVYKVK